MAAIQIENTDVCEVPLPPDFTDMLKLLPDAFEGLKSILNNEAVSSNCFDSLSTFNAVNKKFFDLDRAQQFYYKILMENEFLNHDAMSLLIQMFRKFMDQMMPTRFIDPATDENYPDYQKLMIVAEQLRQLSDCSERLNGVVGSNPLTWQTLLRLYSEFGPAVWTNTLPKGVLGLLQKMFDFSYYLLARDNPENITQARKHGLLTIIKPFRECNNSYLRICSVLFQTYAFTEQEAKENYSGDKWLKYFVNNFNVSFNAANKRCSDGMSSSELLKTIDRAARNKENATKLIDIGLLDRLEATLDEGEVKEKDNACLLLWSLMFHADIAEEVLKRFKDKITLLLDVNRMIINSESDTFKGPLGAIQKEDYESLLKTLEGLWFTMDNFYEKPSTLSVTDVVTATEGHVMISYQHKNIETVQNVVENVKRCGYKVWIDSDNMSGNIFEAMAQAVEDATCVIMCISKAYELSQNCQLEAQFAHKKQKPVIPIIVENGYRADGWLGLMLGGKLYYDFGGKRDFKMVFHSFLQALEESTKQKAQNTMAIKPAVEKKKVIKTGTFTDYQGIVNITESDLTTWHQSNGISNELKDKLKCGKTLAMLKRLQHSAPEHFYNTLRNEFELKKCLDLFQVVDALDKFEDLCFS